MRQTFRSDRPVAHSRFSPRRGLLRLAPLPAAPPPAAPPSRPRRHPAPAAAAAAPAAAPAPPRPPRPRRRAAPAPGASPRPRRARRRPRPSPSPNPSPSPRRRARRRSPTIRRPALQPETFFTTSKASERYAAIVDAGGWPKVGDAAEARRERQAGVGAAPPPRRRGRSARPTAAGGESLGRRSHRRR